MIRRLKNRCARWRTSRAEKFLLDEVERILKNDQPPDTKKSEADFDQLQASFPSNRGDLYKYDDFSLYERASQRALQILKLTGMAESGKKILDIGAGDGVLGAILENYGHSVVLTDMEDWRSRVGKTVEFQPANISEGLPFDDSSFDLVVSYNSFEHFPNPSMAFSEAARVTKSSGLLHFDFGPLYCSSWGLHAYRSLYMPYPQFLFSDSFLQARLHEIGITDLGKKRTELQVMNRWKSVQFQNLWQTERFEALAGHWHEEYNNLHIVKQYPESFQGRALCINDLTHSGVSISLRKR